MTYRDDGSSKPADAPWRPSGIGHASTFLCGRCDTPSLTTGRRLRRVLGLRTYVCARCIAKEPKA